MSTNRNADGHEEDGTDDHHNRLRQYCVSFRFRLHKLNCLAFRCTHLSIYLAAMKLSSLHFWPRRMWKIEVIEKLFVHMNFKFFIVVQ
jgi:hypothetical protein